MKPRELKIATAKTKNTLRWTNTHTDQHELTYKAHNPQHITTTTTEYQQLTKNHKDKLKDIGGFVAGHLKNGYRRKNHVLTRSLITLDLDNLPPETDLPNHLNNQPYAWLIHTTLSHTPQQPRWRLWIWLTQDITADQYGAISRRLAQDINPGLTWFDPTTFEPERLMYWPATLTDSDYQVHTSHKKPTLDPQETLKRYNMWQDVTTWPGITPTNTPTTTHNTTTVENPLAKPGMIGAFNRAWPLDKTLTTLLADHYKPGTTKNRWTYTHGSSTNGLITYNNTLCYSQHATDPAANGHTHSAFDLVRIHKYGHLDEQTTNTPTNKLPSFLAMTDFATHDPATRKENANTITEVFTTLDNKTPSTPHTPQDIIANPHFQLKRNGEPEKTLGNFELIFHHDPHLKNLSWNLLAACIEVRDPQQIPWTKTTPGWTENDNAQLKSYIANTYAGLYAPTIMYDALLSVASQRQYHPVREYFTGLPPWDKTPRIDTLLVDTLGAPNTKYTHAITRKTLVAAVRRTLSPGTKFDTVLTLVGPQGVGKSTIFAKLGGQWFSDSLTITDMKDKTGAEKLTGNLIVEISELAGIRKTEAEPIKSFISRTDDKYRPAYGRTVETHPRQCIIVGTTNAEDGFLRDPTGGRRWWVIHVTGKGETPPHTLDAATIDQIWAEAIYYEKQGETLYLTGEVADIAKQVQTDALESDDRIGLVAEYLDTDIPESWDSLPLESRRFYLQHGHLTYAGAGEHYMAQTPLTLVPRQIVSKMEIWAECFGRDPDAMRKLDAHDITAIMQKIEGWEDSGTRKRLPIYGRQRIFQRTNVPKN
ncbi:VapE domain-containing protein [Corynebacterium kutscheri]|uniref:VapE domain-containing protein n=1 Tax=Corynebacterium kutscheri TaxID=35755 RepID=UPI0037C139B5